MTTTTKYTVRYEIRHGKTLHETSVDLEASSEMDAIKKFRSGSPAQRKAVIKAVVLRDGDAHEKLPV